ncbi:MAG: carbohydrate binding family 9 domain-containing protein [Bacteroidetes bacterium]|nr:carbohydrate binding family 9 domain-containing protein [Bacteroidota bacterium]
MRKFLPLFYFLTFILSANAQDIQRKQLIASRITSNIHIDGILNEPEWADVAEATDFTQFQFVYGKPSAYATSIKVMYDNTAIYIGATMYDPHPDSIQKDLAARDEFGSADFIGIIMDPYQEGVNGIEFFVTASGVQAEAKTYPNSDNGEDFTWDAVWVSAAKITEKGWVAELKIPFSAIRFPNKDEQSWYINFVREVKRNRDKSAWNAIDP